jgi:putative phosphoesterase
LLVAGGAARMKIGILSDTHDRLPTIDAAMAEFVRHGVEAMIHPGDIVAPFAAKRLFLWKGPLYVTYGNNDGERKGLKAILPQIQDGPLLVELSGRRILVHHYLDWCQASDLRRADIVITGHTHEVVNEMREGKLFINPGECCGWISGRCTAAILDTDGPSAEIIELKPC